LFLILFIAQGGTAMTEHKFTDEEIIKALGICAENTIVGGRFIYRGVPLELLCNAALDLINRQKAEIERLNILVNDAKTKTVGKFVPRDYIQLTIDDMESET
jgi:hypothetical protein